MRTSRKSGPFFRTFSQFAPVFRALPRFFPVFYLVMCLFAWYHYTYKTTAKSTPFRDLYRFAETTHTPQGDGNVHVLEISILPCGNDPHPARGRKQRGWRNNFDFRRKRPTPHKGTETRRSPYTGLSSAGNNSHPARGRKLPLRERAVVLAVETIYTPQGDENHYSISFPSNISWKQLSPRKGTETTSQTRT